MFLISTASASRTFAQTTQPTDASADGFPNVKLVADGPDWTLGQIFAEVGPGTVMAYDPKKPPQKIEDPTAALRSCFEFLRSPDRKDQEAAFRLTSVTARSLPNCKPAARLLALMYHHGIGTKSDRNAALRCLAPTIQSGDASAARYVAKRDGSYFISLTRKLTTFKQLDGLPPASPMKFRGTIVDATDKSLTLQDADKATLKVDLPGPIEDAKQGRVVDIAGISSAKGFVGLVNVVPKPNVTWRWNLLGDQAVIGGTWQTRRVRVTFKNDGAQNIKSLTARVRCYVNDGKTNDQTQEVSCTDLAAGSTKSIEASFDIYNYQYVDHVAAPKAEVTIIKTDW